VEPEELGNGSINMSVATDTHITVELLEAVSSMRSVPRLYNDEKRKG
jgi:hypothetical protein